MYNDDFGNRLVNEDLFNINAEKYAKRIGKQDKVIIWGCGNAGEQVYKFLEKFGIQDRVINYADNSIKKWGKEINHLTILSPDEVVEKVKINNNIHIIIASEYLADIRRQLLSLRINEENIDMSGIEVAKDYVLFQNKSPYLIIKSNFNKFQEVYSMLEDERSRNVYLGILNCKIALNNEYLKGIADPENKQYFDRNIINLKDNEVFCDCGSYNGDTLEQFNIITNGQYNKYIAIEADKTIFDELNKKIATNNYKNVSTYNIACWNEKTTLNFQSADSAGHIAESGGVFIQADALDNVLENEKITMLKMDIEGAEEMALNGAKKLISIYKPILAICIYHSLEDYYKLPLLMKSFNKEYKFFIRHYKDMFDHETVCYAIPKSRCV